MSTPASVDASVDRLAVLWRPDAELDAADNARLDRLVHQLTTDVLEDALDRAVGRDEQVCLRRVELAGHCMRWETTDTELVTGWGTALTAAIAAAVAAAGTDVVRFPSRSHARVDAAISVLRGDRSRSWAWQMLGLWPGDGASDAAALRLLVADVLREEPQAATALVAVAAAGGELERLLSLAGADTLAELARRAWLVAGGAPVGRRRAVVAGPLGAPARELAALVAKRSVVHARALEWARRSGPLARHMASASWPATAADALAALALLEAEPAMATRLDAPEVIAALAEAIAMAAAKPAPASVATDVRPAQEGGATAAADGPAAAAIATVRPPAVGIGPAPDAPEAGVGVPGRPSEAERSDPAKREPAREQEPTRFAPQTQTQTRWGGLLFLLSLIGGSGLPSRAADDPLHYGPALRPFLHELGRHLLGRAAPDIGPADVDDPAILAFCGLAPDDEPPRRPSAAVRAVIEREADTVVAALRARIGGSAGRTGDQVPVRTAADRALLAATCRRRAVIEADPGWIDVRLELDEVTVEVRRAGLDLDPGYLPWLGCVVRFRYG